MEKELDNIKNNVMDKIHNGEVKMKPKIYFMLGSALTLIGVILSSITSIFLVGLVRFSIRSNGVMSQYKIDQMVRNFPWWTTVLAILALVLGIWLIRKYDFSYKANFLYIILLFVITIIISGWIVDIAGLNDVIYKHGPGPMQGIMRRQLQAKPPLDNRYFRR